MSQGINGQASSIPELDGVGFTRTEQRMFDILADGYPHDRRQLHECLPDQAGAIENVRIHIHNIRKKLRPLGHDVVCESVSGWLMGYRLVRLVGSAYDGYR